MRYVGFSEDFHDSALSIIDKGVVTYASHSERYSKKKNDKKIHEDLWSEVREDDSLSFYEGDQISPSGFIHRRNTSHHGKALQPIYYHNHHKSHCAMAFYTRPWESTKDTVMVSIDGVGEGQCATIYNHKFELLHKWDNPKSVGLVYTTATDLLGLRPLEDEYVVMGLSSYGTAPPDMVKYLIGWWNSIRDFPEHKSDAELIRRMDYRTAMRNELTKFLAVNSREDFAAGIQEFAKYGIMTVMTLARQWGSKVVYGGGCAQNVVINTLIHKMFDEVHIAISPTDAGSSLGCAALQWAKETGGDRLVWSPYSGYNIRREVNPRLVVDHLLDAKVCGLANGKAEFGPRALGNRSLIADVRYDVKDTVNDIKQRQKYRPFAPAILEEYADEYFSGPMNEYMQYTSIAKHDYDSVTHVDGTARVQIVKKDCKSVFRKVIEEYYERTGVPMLLNTSLNIRGRPMVNDEHDAHLWEQKYGVKVF